MNDIMDLIDAYAEARHRCGCAAYNATTADARQLVADYIASIGAGGVQALSAVSADDGWAPPMPVVFKFEKNKPKPDAYAAYTVGQLHEAYRAGIAAAATPPAISAGSAVPAGWKLVPVEPTLAMIDAALAVDPAHESVWAAYLAASPTPPAEQAAPATQQAGDMAAGYVIDLIGKLVQAESNKTRTHQEYMGKAMPDDVYARFQRLRDEAIPALRTQLLDVLAAALPPSKTANAAESAPDHAGLVYAELPRAGAIGYASVVDVDRYATHMTIGPHLPGVRDIALWTTDQSRDFADRTHALRVSSGKVNTNGLR